MASCTEPISKKSKSDSSKEESTEATPWPTPSFWYSPTPNPNTTPTTTPRPATPTPAMPSPTPVSTPNAAQRFSNAQAVLNAKCLSCHGNFSSYTTESLWVSSGYVVAKSLVQSKVYFRLTGANLNVSNENMPTGTALTSTEMYTIRIWIENMGVTPATPMPTPVITPTPRPATPTPTPRLATPTPLPPTPIPTMTPVVPTPIPTPNASQRFNSAYSILTAKCLSCHGNFGTYTTETLWINNSYVVARSLAQSKVYFRLTGANLGIASENMPQGSTLSSSEMATLRAWIENIGGTPTPTATPVAGVPLTPTNLVATAVARNQITLTWDDVAGETAYRVARSTDNVNFTNIALNLAANSTTFQSSSLAADTRYYYRLYAKNAVGESPPAIAEAQTFAAPPSQPGSVAIQTLSSSQIKLSWNDVATNEDGYKVERSLTTSNYVIIATLPQGSSSFTDSSLQANTKYYYRVFAFNGGGESTHIARNATTSVGSTPTPTPPTSLPGPEQRFASAQSVIQNKCLSCHSGTNPAKFSSFTTESLWLSSGFVVAKNISASKIYYRLNGAGLGIGTENMPKGNSALTEAERNLIKVWIENIGVAVATPTPVPVTQAFLNAKNVFTAKCVSCHGNFNSYTTEDQWVSNGYVVANNLRESRVYFRLTGAALGVGNENMPLGTAALSASEMDIVKAWIEGMGTGGPAPTPSTTPVVTPRPPLGGLTDEDVLYGFPVGLDQMAKICGPDRYNPSTRKGVNKVTQLFCDPSKSEPKSNIPPITSLKQLQEALGLGFANPNGLSGFVPGGEGNASFAITAHSSSLVAKFTSSINPRVIVMTPGDGAGNNLANPFVVMGFVRGEQFVELIARNEISLANNVANLSFYLFRFERDCSITRTCTNYDTLTPVVEKNWVSYSLYEDEDIKNTILDCKMCHQPTMRYPKILRMQEIEAPWPHFIRTPFGGTSQEVGQGVEIAKKLMADFESAKGVGAASEGYGGIPGPLLNKGLARVLEQLVERAGFQSFNPSSSAVFPSKAVNTANDTYVPLSWLGLFETFISGGAVVNIDNKPFPMIAPSSYKIRVADVTKMQTMAQAYKDVMTGAKAPSTLPDIRDVFPDDPNELAYIGIRVKPGLDGRGILMNACKRCHHSELDQSLTRARFNVDLSLMSREERDLAIYRISLPEEDLKAMPPRRFMTLTEEEKQRLIQYLRQ